MCIKSGCFVPIQTGSFVSVQTVSDPTYHTGLLFLHIRISTLDFALKFPPCLVFSLVHIHCFLYFKSLQYHKTIFIDTEKALEKIQHAFIVKTLEKIERELYFLNMIVFVSVSMSILTTLCLCSRNIVSQDN